MNKQLEAFNLLLALRILVCAEVMEEKHRPGVVLPRDLQPSKVPSSFRPQSTPRAVAHEAGGGWRVVHRHGGLPHLRAYSCRLENTRNLPYKQRLVGPKAGV
jgi:hypothetical protein